MHNLIIDIETIPNQNLSDDKKPQFDPNTVKLGNVKDPDKRKEKIDQARKQFEEGLTKKMSIESDYAQILCMGIIWIDDRGEVVKTDTIYDGESDKTIVEWFANIYDGNKIIGWNCREFDCHLLWKRGLYHGVNVFGPAYFQIMKKYSSEVCLDLMSIWSNYGYAKLKDCCKFLDIPCKEGLDGSQIYTAYKEGRKEDIIKYCLSDCEAVRQIYKKIF